MNSIVHKVGDTFEYIGALSRKELDVDGNETFSTDFTGWGARCQIRDRHDDSVVFEINFSWVDESVGACLFEQERLETEKWIAGYYESDVELTTPEGKTISTNTFNLDLRKDVTRD